MTIVEYNRGKYSIKDRVKSIKCINNYTGNNVVWLLKESGYFSGCSEEYKELNEVLLKYIKDWSGKKLLELEELEKRIDCASKVMEDAIKDI